MDQDDIFFADLNKQISLLIMDDDDDDEIKFPVSGYRHPSANSFQVLPCIISLNEKTA